MAGHRIFTSFAIEDVRLRDLLCGQAKNAKSPFEFVDMSVKEPWSSDWKARCRTKIKGCDGVIGLITNNTRNASGQIFELQAAYEEDVPVMLVWGYADQRPTNLPDPIAGRRINVWTWSNIEAFLDRL